MIDALKSFFARNARPAAAGATDSDRSLRIAACALLLEVAHADDTFTEDERIQVEEVLGRHFDLEASTTRELMALAEQERREATDLHQFTSLINQQYDEGQRMVLAELLWRVVYADGRLSQHEDSLARKLAHLLELRPGYLSAARQRAVKPPAAGPD